MRMEATRGGMLDTIDATLKTRLADLLGAGPVTLERAVP